MKLTTLLGGLAFAAAVAFPAPAAADIVRLTNGRTIVVDACEFDGERVILTLRGGGEIRAHKSIIDEILPDEVPYARAVAIEARDTALAMGGGSPERQAVLAWVDVVADQIGVDRRLAHAIVRAESNYDPYAVSSKGAMGLMQLMPATAADYGVARAELFDVERNLQTGMRHFRKLMERLDNLPLALAAYNAGEGAVQRYGGIPPYRETQNYVRKILSFYTGG